MPLKIQNKEEMKKIVSLVKERYENAQSARREYEQQWHINKAFLEGDQYVFWNASILKLERLKQIPHRKRHVSNIILPHWNREIAKLGRNDPIFNVVQNSDEESDITAAKLGEQVLQHTWRAQDMPEEYLELRGWLSLCGTVFLSIGWDPMGGDYIEQYKQEEIPEPFRDGLGNIVGERPSGRFRDVVDARGEYIIDKNRSAYQGEVSIDVISAFQVFPANQNISKIKEQPWIIKGKIKPIEDIKWRYGKAADDIKSGDAEGGEYPKLSSFLGGKDSEEKAGDSKGCLIREMWEKPTNKYPKGRIVTTVDDILLRYEELPYGRYDLIKFIRTRRQGTGSFWGISQIESSVPLQNEWNKILSSVIEHRDTMKKGKVLVPTTAGIQKSAFVTEHAEFIEFNPIGGPPFQMATANIGEDIWKELQIIKETMQDLWSQHEVTKAQVPGQVKSGVAIEQLIEQDDTTLGPVFQSITNGLSKAGHWMLDIIEKNYTEQRVVKIIGRDAMPEVKYFMGADLKGNHDVSVQIGSALPYLKISRMNEIKDRANMGFYGPISDPAVRRKVLQMLEDSTVTRGDETRLDELNQKREYNQMVETQQYVPTKTYDNHEIHIETLQRLRKGFECQTIVAENPQIDALFEQHVMEHGMEVAKQLDMFQQAEPLQGGKPAATGNKPEQVAS